MNIERNKNNITTYHLHLIPPKKSHVWLFISAITNKKFYV